MDVRVPAIEQLYAADCRGTQRGNTRERGQRDRSADAVAIRIDQGVLSGVVLREEYLAQPGDDVFLHAALAGVGHAEEGVATDETGNADGADERYRTQRPEPSATLALWKRGQTGPRQEREEGGEQRQLAEPQAGECERRHT